MGLRVGREGGFEGGGIIGGNKAIHDTYTKDCDRVSKGGSDSVARRGRNTYVILVRTIVAQGSSKVMAGFCTAPAKVKVMTSESPSTKRWNVGVYC